MKLDAEAVMAQFASRGGVIVEDPRTGVIDPAALTQDELQEAALRQQETMRPSTENAKKAELPSFNQIVLARIELMGVPASAVYFKTNSKTIKKWQEGTERIPIDALQLALERPASTEDRQAIRQIEVLSNFDLPSGDVAVTQAVPRTPVQLCIPVKGDVPLPVAVSWVALALKQAPFFKWQADTMLTRSRNMITDHFLKSGLPWSLWLDSDVIPPLGNPWFAEMTGPRKLGMKTLECDLIPRLLSHNQPVVGGTYAARAEGGSLIAQPDLTPQNEQDLELANAIRNGSAEGLHRVKWAASGCLLIHRDVFLRVREIFQGDLPVPPNEPFPFWNPVGNEGEDIALCNRINACQIPIFLDTTLVLGHLGKRWFLPEGTVPARKL